jgi:hypothetical protein
MKAIIIYIITFISIAHIRADVSSVKTFTCKSSYNVFDTVFQQGEELFIDVYINENENGNIDVKASQMYGPEYQVHSDKKFFIGATRTTVATSSRDSSYLSMVFLGADNWGLFLKTIKGQGPDFLPAEIEVMCKQIDFSVI